MGYDVLVGYVPSIEKFPDTAVLTLFGWVWAPFTIVLLRILSIVSLGNTYLFLKFFGPTLYGCFSLSFYYMVRGGFGWAPRKSLVTSMIFLMQPAILRLGWDQFREILGLSFLFGLIVLTRGDFAGVKRRPWLILGLTLMIVATHELVSVLMLLVLSWQVAARLLSKTRLSATVALFVPSGLLFAFQFYCRSIGLPPFAQSFMPVVIPHSVVFTNYLGGPPSGVSDYTTLVIRVASLSAYALTPILPLAFLGFRKDSLLLPMLGWLTSASFDSLILPQFALSYFWWWLLLLALPLSVYAGSGLEKLSSINAFNRFQGTAIFLLLLAMLAVGYSTSTIRLGYPGAYAYMPSSLVESSVRYSEIPHLESAIEWSNQNAPRNAILLLPENFEGFAILHGRSDLRVRVAPPSLSLAQVVTDYGPIGVVFAIYYTDQVGTLQIPRVAEFGEIGVFNATMA